MPRIVLLLEDCGQHKAKAIAAIRKSFGLGVAEIASSIGGAQPLLDRSMFSRADPDMELRLLELMTVFDELSARYAAYEVLDGQQFVPEARDSYFRISRERLVNMISARDLSLRRLRENPEGAE